jgi:hypothetical protein
MEVNMELILGLSLFGLGIFFFGLCIGTITERKAVNTKIRLYQSLLKNKARNQSARGLVAGSNTASE